MKRTLHKIILTLVPVFAICLWAKAQVVDPAGKELVFAEESLQVPSSGKIELYKDFPSSYIRRRNVEVWLPPNYSHYKKFSVLYMHDGQMLFDSARTWNHQEWDVETIVAGLVKENKIKDCIVVGIWNTGATRGDEYFPQRSYESLPDTLKISLKVRRLIMKPEADNYLKFIVKELKPFIDKNFSVLTDPANTFIAGSSMGGLISLYAICEYPGVFGGAACMSTHWPGTVPQPHDLIPHAFQQYLEKNLPQPQHHRIYFDYGTATLDSLYKPYQDEVDKIMRAKGYSDATWMTKEFQGDAHTEGAWRRRLHIPLVFLLGK